MYSPYLITVLAVAWSASLVQAELRGTSLRQVNDVLDARPSLSNNSIPTYVKVAKAALEAKSKSWVVGGDTIKLLEQFIEIGKSILAEDCSERSLHLIESFPIKSNPYDGYNGYSGLSSWDTATNMYNSEYNRICYAKLRVAEKQLHATLDKSQVRKVERLAKIAAPIIEQANDRYISSMATDLAVRFASFFEPLLTQGAEEFDKELLDYLQQESKQSDVKSHLPKVFDQYIMEPCSNYTGSTSGIFVQQINRYKDFGLDDEEYLGHFFGYQLCRFLDKKRSQLWEALEK